MQPPPDQTAEPVDRRRRRRAIVGWGAAVFVVLSLLALRLGMASTIHNNLTERSWAELRAAGITQGMVSFSGQDGVYRGPQDVPGDVVERIRGKWGLHRFRIVHTDGPVPTPAATTTTTTAATTTAATTTAATTTAAPTTTTTAPPTTTTAATTTTTVAKAASPTNSTAAFDAGRITVTGQVQSEAQRAKLVAAATAAVGAANVVDNLTVVGPEGATAAKYIDAFTGLIGRLTVDNIVRGTASLADTTMSFNGSAASVVGYTAIKTAEQAATDAGATVSGTLGLTLQNIRFAPNSATIDPTSTATLDEAVAFLVASPSSKVGVEGHTDSDGPAGTNQALSQARAQAVVDYLVAGGVSADRLTATGFGADRPVAPNDTPDNKALNRRIEFNITGG